MTKISFSSIRNKKKETKDDIPPASKINFNLPLRITEQEVDPNQPVTIYLHYPSHKSVKVTLQAQLSMLEIKQIVQDKLSVRKDRQVLYLNGKNITEYGNIRLYANNIIHISDFEGRCKKDQKMTIKLTIVNFIGNNKDKMVKQYEINADSTVGDFLDNISCNIKTDLRIDSECGKLELIESSRLLEKNKTFLDQDLPKIAQVVCVVTENQIKTRFSNDTKEEIFQDISDLLGFESPIQEEVNKQQKCSIRPRYLPQIQTRPKPRQANINTDRNYEDDDPYGLRASSQPNYYIPNFKKKSKQLSKAHSFDQLPRNPITSLKASKSKQYIENLLKREGKQMWVFESPDTIKQTGGEQKQQEEEVREVEVEIEKPRSSPLAPRIPKVMPIKERRKMKLEFDLLFGDNSDSKSDPPPASEAPEQKERQKEQIKPISPPTQSRVDSKLRLSLGSRPIFLDQIRFPISKKNNQSQ